MSKENKKPRKKREYTSMFDPFREDIEKWCDAGLTLRQAFNKLPEGYSFSSFYEYLRVHGIRGNRWRGELDARNVCNKCEYCKRFVNEMGVQNKVVNRICTKYWRLLSGSVRYCPMWCEYRGGEVGEQEEQFNGTENS